MVGNPLFKSGDISEESWLGTRIPHLKQLGPCTGTASGTCALGPALQLESLSAEMKTQFSWGKGKNTTHSEMGRNNRSSHGLCNCAGGFTCVQKYVSVIPSRNKLEKSHAV